MGLVAALAGVWAMAAYWSAIQVTGPLVLGLWCSLTVVLRRRCCFPYGGTLLVVVTLAVSLAALLVLFSFNLSVVDVPSLKQLHEVIGARGLIESIKEIMATLGWPGLLGWFCRLAGLLICLSALAAVGGRSAGNWITPNGTDTAWTSALARIAGSPTRGRPFGLADAAVPLIGVLLGAAMASPWGMGWIVSLTQR